MTSSHYFLIFFRWQREHLFLLLTAVKRSKLFQRSMVHKKELNKFFAIVFVLVLRRGEIEVDIVSIERNGHEPIICSRQVRILPDKSLNEVKGKDYDCIVIPGGNDGLCKRKEKSLNYRVVFFSNRIFSGSKALAANANVGEILTRHYNNGKVVGAICAGPRVLLAHKIGVNHQHTITCYPTVRKEFTDGQPYKLDDENNAVCHSRCTEKSIQSQNVFSMIDLFVLSH